MPPLGGREGTGPEPATSPEPLTEAETLLELALFLVVNAGLRDTDAWQAARGAAVARWALLMGRHPIEARRSLTMLGRARDDSNAAIAALIGQLSGELRLSAE